MASASQPLLLSLPRELRDEVYLLLAHPEHVYTSTPTNSERSLRRFNKAPEVYIDTRIYVPARAPANVLATCKQLREECLDTISHLINSSTPIKNNSTEPEALSERGLRVAQKDEDTDLEELAETTKDDGSVRLTLEIMRPVRGNMGAVYPAREMPSPRFLAMLPLLSRVRKIKFVILATYDWWKGPPPQRRTRVTTGRVRSLVKRVSSDQTDEVLSTPEDENDSTVTPDPKPNPVTVAIHTILKHLPLVEEVKIDALLTAGEYWNWDLPEKPSAKVEGLQGWLNETVHAQDGSVMKKVYRRLIACVLAPPSRGAIFYHQLETCDDTGQGSLVHVAEGTQEVVDEFGETLEAPPFTKMYDRTE